MHKGQLSTNPSGTCRSADGPVAVIALASQKGDAVRRSAFSSGASVVGMELAEKQRRLRCRPADRASGYLRTTTRAGSDDLDGRFLVELATCENVETGKVIEWPPAPLTVRGSFKGLPYGQR